MMFQFRAILRALVISLPLLIEVANDFVALLDEGTRLNSAQLRVLVPG